MLNQSLIEMKRLGLILLLCVTTTITVMAHDFFMVTPSVTKNHLKFKQTSDNTWLMYVPATYPCHATWNSTGFKFMVSDEEGYLYTPQSSGSTIVNGDEGGNAGTLFKSATKRDAWGIPSDKWLEVRKGEPKTANKPDDIVMDGCLVFKITLGTNGNLTYQATLDPNNRVSYAACNTVEGSDNGTLFSADHTNFLFASKQTDGTFSPNYKGKIAIANIPSENYDQIKHNGFYFYTPIQEISQNKYDGDGNDWWQQVKNDLGTRGIDPDGEDLFQNGGNFESPIFGSFVISTTFFWGKNSQGMMDKKFVDAYDDPLVGSIRTYCNQDKNMESRYHVKVFIVTGYNQDKDAFTIQEIPYIPKGVGVLLYTEDATVDKLKPEKEWTGDICDNLEATYGKNFLVPTFTPTDVSTYSTEGETKYINFFLAKLFSAKDYQENENYRDTYGKDNYWGFFSVLNTQTSKANRAYLHYPLDSNFDGLSHFPEKNASGAKGAPLPIGDYSDEPTEIHAVNGVQNKTANNSYYTLDGRKVEKPAHGIFVHNGKTYLFK